MALATDPAGRGSGRPGAAACWCRRLIGAAVLFWLLTGQGRSGIIGLGDGTNGYPRRFQAPGAAPGAVCLERGPFPGVAGDW